MASRKKKNERPTVVTTAGNLRFESATSPRKPKASRPKVVVGVAQDISPVSNFLGFLKQHAVVGLIIGFVLGTQVQTLVKQLVQSFIDPLTQLLFGTALSARVFTLHFNGRSAQFGWGALVYAIIIFIFVLFTMYIVIKLLKLEEAPDTKK